MRAFDEGNLRTAHRAAVEQEVVVSDNTDWQGLGFNSPPFEDSNDVRFFPIGAWENSFDEVSIFCKGQDPLLVIPAITGSGKSVFLNEFISRQPHPEQCHYLKARSIFTVRHLLNAISDHFSEFRHASGNTEQFLNELRSVTAEAGPQLLVIDDAQRLSKETLSNLLHILAAQDLSSLWLRVVLCGEPQVEDRVQSLFDELELSFSFPAITLDAMTMNETRSYLKHRLDGAGFEGNFPFSKSMVKHIHTLASGFPGRVNRVAQQVIIDGAKNETGIHHSAGAKSVGEAFHVHRTKLVSFAALAIAGWLVWQYQPFQVERSQWSHADLTSSILLDASSSNSSAAVSTPNKTVTSTSKETQHGFIETAVPLKQQPRDLSMSQQKLLSSNSGLRIALPVSVAPKAESDSLLDVATLPVTPPLKVASASDVQKNLAPMVASIVPAPQSKVDNQVIPSLVLTAEQKLTFSKTQQDGLNHPAKVATSSSRALVASKKTVAVNAPVTIAMHAKTVKRQHPAVSTSQFAHTGYTVQLLGVHDKAKLIEFAKQQHLEAKGAYFASQFHNKPWYVLVYGQFENAQAAHKAVAQLPAELQNQHPWVKPVASIHASVHWLNAQHQS